MTRVAQVKHTSGGSFQTLVKQMKNIILASLTLILLASCSEEKRWFDVEVVEEELSKSTTVDPGVNLDDIKEYLTTNYEIEGNWKFQDWHDGVDLTIERISGNQYRITCRAWGDLGTEWILEREGVFENGILTLNKPIKEYLPVDPYRHFYCIQTPSDVRLMQPYTVRDWVLEPDTPDWGVIEKFASLKQMKAQPAK